MPRPAVRLIGPVRADAGATQEPDRDATREGTRLQVVPEQADKVQAESRIFPTRYWWEGDVTAGTRQQFVTVLVPHAPTRDASPLAAGITVLADWPGLAAVRANQDTRCELAILNADRTALELQCKAADSVATDAHAAYQDFDGGRLRGRNSCRGLS